MFYTCHQLFRIIWAHDITIGVTIAAWLGQTETIAA